MAKYLILIYGDEKEWAAATPEERKQKEAAHLAFMAAAGSRVVGGEELMPPDTATTVRRGDADRPAVTDGPFLETKEVLGGFYVLEAADLDEVIALAATLPEVAAAHSGVEIRPLVDHS
ncbi:YciI family protein [Actinoplanes friuliensis]|uniref:YCII-related domain-containing protein n=1 Tax=Actinoplanes friuliensis DSM 7358 TaxID=1246995 RepID=U5VZ05_9ACTN|nr:YciI family protein [Actinoplanes friuliensis]AGZ42203.1 hypothetical protein AFR_19655 [Actinoplanes friuliensis DSM 7358]